MNLLISKQKCKKEKSFLKAIDKFSSIMKTEEIVSDDDNTDSELNQDSEEIQGLLDEKFVNDLKTVSMWIT